MTRPSQPFETAAKTLTGQSHDMPREIWTPRCAGSLHTWGKPACL